MSPKTDGRSDFDFLQGRWQIRNRRRRTVLQGCDEWQEFPASVETEPVLGGMGHVDRFAAELPDGTLLDGLTLRIFHPETQLWSLHWSDSQSCALFPPVVGRFVGDRGEFYGTDMVHGKEVQVVFTWTRVDADSAHWAQAFSLDDGRSWEWNWEMDFTRVA